MSAIGTLLLEDDDQLLAEDGGLLLLDLLPASGLQVRERPPLHHTVIVAAPNGHRFRWAGDEPRAENRPSGLRDSSTMPGGHERAECSLPRQPEADYGDLGMFNDLRILDHAGEVVFEGRTEGVPKASGDELAVDPEAVGYQAVLSDNQAVVALYALQAAGEFSTPPLWRRAEIAAAGFDSAKVSGGAGEDGGLVFDFPNEALPTGARADLWRQGRAGAKVGKVQYRGARTGTFTNITSAQVRATDSDAAAAALDSYAATLDNTIRETVLTTPRKHVTLIANIASAVTPPAGTQERWNRICLYGDHGLTLYPIDGETAGLLCSDIVAHAVGRWAPELRYTIGPAGTIRPTAYPINHLPIDGETTVGEIVQQAARFELPDWAVWGRWYHLHPRGQGERARTWVARVGPAKLRHTGVQASRLYGSIVVGFSDVDGTARTVGPPGSGADIEDALLADDDPDNPAAQLEGPRRFLLRIGVANPAQAVVVGAMWLDQMRLVDRSGQAEITGWAQTDRGVWHPYSHVQAGDRIRFLDAADPAPRHIVKADHNHDARSVAIDLDAPPNAIDAVQERMAVALESFS